MENTISRRMAEMPDRAITVEGVWNNLGKTESSKSLGPDGAHPAMMKPLADVR